MLVPSTILLNRFDCLHTITFLFTFERGERAMTMHHPNAQPWLHLVMTTACRDAVSNVQSLHAQEKGEHQDENQGFSWTPITVDRRTSPHGFSIAFTLSTHSHFISFDHRLNLSLHSLRNSTPDTKIQDKFSSVGSTKFTHTWSSDVTTMSSTWIIHH